MSTKKDKDNGHSTPVINGDTPESRSSSTIDRSNPTDNPTSGSPTSGSPTSGSPDSGNPASGSPDSGNPTSGSPGAGNDPASGITRTRKPRPASSERGKPAASSKVDLTKQGQKTLALQLVGVHQIIGIFTGLGEVAHITDEQAEGMTQAILDVMNQYKIKPNPKAVAWANLVGVCAAVYAPKIGLIMLARKLQAESQPKPDNKTILKPVNTAPANGGVMNFG